MAFDYNSEAETEYKTSKINSAGLINLRMNSLWIAADACSMNANIKQWYLILDTIWGNLAADASTDEIKEYNKYLDTLLEKGFFGVYRQKPGFAVATPEENTNRHFYFRILREIQIFLKKVENKQGKGSSYKDPYDDDFD